MQAKGSDIFTLILLCAVIVMGGYIWHTNGKDDYRQYERTIDSLDVAISILEKDQLVQDSLLNTYKTQLDSLEVEKLATEKEINDIRQFYGKAIKDIHKLSVAQLDSFFTARYNRTRL